jgi:hypothetical protein
VPGNWRTTSSVVTGAVCFQESAKLIFTADIRRKADNSSVWQFTSVWQFN